MNIEIAIRVTYDRDKDKGLREFRDKYHKFKAHIAQLQASGTLPRGDIAWELRVSPRTPPPSPAKVIRGPWMAVRTDAVQRHFVPTVAHRAGEPLRMDPLRIAL